MAKAEKIPKIIHQIWIGPKKRPDKYLKTWSEDYMAANPDYTYIFWDDKKIDTIMMFNKHIKKIYDSESTYFGKADVARYLILYYYGGIYIDADSVWINNKSLDPLIDGGGDFFVGIEPIRNWYANGVIGCTPFNVKMQSLLQYLDSISDKYTEMRQTLQVWKMTGPMCINRLDKNYYKNKFSVVKHVINHVTIDLFETLEAAQECMKEHKYASIIYDMKNDIIIDYFGTERYYMECYDYVKSVYDTPVVAYPAQYFYPVDWQTISDAELHTKIELPSESYMFQYGISTNGDALKY